MLPKECDRWGNIILNEGRNGLIHDCEITFTDKTDPTNPTRREFFWMRVLKTLAPLGLDEGSDYSFESAINLSFLYVIWYNLMIVIYCC